MIHNRYFAKQTESDGLLLKFSYNRGNTGLHSASLENPTQNCAGHHYCTDLGVGRFRQLVNPARQEIERSVHCS